MSDKPRSVWSPILPIPEDVPVARVRHPTRGDPLRIFFYNNAEGHPLGRMCRFTTSSGEAVHLPLTWCQDQEGIRGWRWIQFQRFRPMFGLDKLEEFKADPLGFVVIVFDEFEADCAAKLLPSGCCVVSWPGGLRKIDEVDWSPLKGLKVVIWPTLSMDHLKVKRDIGEGGALLPRERQPNWQAALKLEKITIGFGCQVLWIVDPFSPGKQSDRYGVLPNGFGAGMAALQDWDTNKAWDFIFDFAATGRGSEIDQRLRKLNGERVAADPPVDESQPAQTDEKWHLNLLTKHGEVVPCLANVHDILANSKSWQGVIAFDEFAQRVVKLKAPVYIGGVAGEWESTDDSRTAMMLSRLFKFTPSSALVTEAVEVIARENGFHPPRRWLRGLVWDGIPRIDDWMFDFLSVAKTEYSIRVARWFLMGMVARVMKPGVKFDYCLVLEGTQGRMKSSALAALGGEWFGDTDINLDNKDSMSALRGKWLYEFQEMGSLARHEASKQKSFISRQVDEFRPVYGRREIRCPRQVVFAGSTNDWEWNKDPTGGRRFWPAPVDHDVDIEGLKAAREQLFAEALVRFEKGERYWPTSAEQREFFDPEQLKREQQDSLVDALHDWVFEQYKEFSIAMAGMDGLKMDASKLTRDIQTRIGISLRKLGCTKVERRNGMTRFWYKPPEKPAKVISSISAQQFSGDEHEAF
jgi:predicted P-loop ATPase